MHGLGLVLHIFQHQISMRSDEDIEKRVKLSKPNLLGRIAGEGRGAERTLFGSVLYPTLHGPR